MKQWITLLTAALAFTVLGNQQVEAHCQIPCGIYHDDLVIHEMDQCIETMNKAVNEISSNKMDSPLARNQLVRWVNNKDDYCDRFVDYVTEYFLQQRIKPDAEELDAKLASAHLLLVQSMKVKQTVDAKEVAALADEFRNFQKLMFPEQKEIAPVH